MKEFVMTGLLIVAVINDVRNERIPNKLIVTGIGICLLIQFWETGVQGIQNSVTAFLFTVIICWPLFWLRAVGAGDIKLLALIGAMHGLNFLFSVVVVLSVLSAIASFTILYKNGLLCERMRYALTYFVSGRAKEEVYYDKKRDGTKITIILTPYTAAAYVTVLIGRWSGIC